VSFFDTKRMVKTENKILKHTTKVQDHTNKTISKIIINLPISLFFYNSLCVKTLISSYIFRIKINIPSSVSFKLTVRYELHQRIASHFRLKKKVLHIFIFSYTDIIEGSTMSLVEAISLYSLISCHLHNK
jgi:hypothetical protein